MEQRNSRSILFLCTGNYYRSRFAEILFNNLAEQMRLPWRAFSRGLALERGIHNVGPMSRSAVETLKRLGVCLGADCERMPQPLTYEDLGRASRIIGLKGAEHLPLLEERFPPWAERVEYWHIEDEPGVLHLIEREVHVLIARLRDDGAAE
ncbi:MAG TPA: low molecular weight phosphatase family protein [Gemmataceae bacterium]|nr:low molecular weight phosphatase family protein [Gemmataceae bacterium]